jgi:hypothetical protein
VDVSTEVVFVIDGCKAIRGTQRDVLGNRAVARSTT